MKNKFFLVLLFSLFSQTELTTRKAPTFFQEVVEFCKIVPMCIAAGCTIGFIQDLVVAIDCPDRLVPSGRLPFSSEACIDHMRKKNLDLNRRGYNLTVNSNPIKIAAIWGVLASWVLSAVLGVITFMVSRFGPNYIPKADSSDVLEELKWTAPIFTGASIYGYAKGLSDSRNPEKLGRHREDASKVGETQRFEKFWANNEMIDSAYSAGALSGLVICWRVWTKRKERKKEEEFEKIKESFILQRTKGEACLNCLEKKGSEILDSVSFSPQRTPDLSNVELS